MRFLVCAYILAGVFGGAAAAADAPEPLAQQQQPASNNLRKAAVDPAFDRDTFDTEYDADVLKAAKDHQDVLDAIDLAGEPEAIFPQPTCNVSGVGFITNPTKAKCEAACSGVPNCSCCDNNGEGGDACWDFEGQVCPDGSCSGGANACALAKIEYVVRSCQGYNSCSNVGGYSANPVQQVVDSCVGEQACQAMAIDGSVESVISSCQGAEACLNVAFESGSSIPYIFKGCNAPKACFKAGKDDVISEPVDTCCNTANACEGITTSDNINCDTYAPSPTPSISDKPSGMPSYGPSGMPSMTPSVASSNKPSVTNMPTPCQNEVQCEPGMCFEAITKEECPSGKYLGMDYLFKVYKKCSGLVVVGELCEGSGECNTDDDLDNCHAEFHGLGSFALDIYRRVECCPEG